MGHALSLDIRKRIIEHVEAGQSARSAARQFRVGVASAIRIVRQYKQTGRIDPKPLGGKRFSKLEPVGDELIGLVIAQPDITLVMLQAHLAEQGVDPNRLNGYNHVIGFFANIGHISKGCNRAHYIIFQYYRFDGYHKVHGVIGSLIGFFTQIISMPLL